MTLPPSTLLPRLRPVAWLSPADAKSKLSKAVRAMRYVSRAAVSASNKGVDDAGAGKRKREKRLSALESLPDDVLLEVFLCLDVPDILALAQVSHTLHAVSTTHALWKALAFRFLCRAKPLLLPSSPIPTASTLSALPACDLRTCVIRTFALDRNWAQPTPRAIAPARVARLGCAFTECLCYVVNFAPRHLLLPMKDGCLVGWDIERDVCVGRYELDRSVPATIINARAQYEAQAFYFVVGKFPLAEPDFHFSILHVQFPDAGRPDAGSQMTFTPLAEFAMPLTIAIEVHILDPARRSVAVLFLCPASDTLGVCVIFDWETGMAAMTDTGLPYLFRKTMIGVRLTADGESVVVHSEQAAREHQRTFALADLAACAAPWRHTLLATCPALCPTSEAAFRWRVRAPEREGAEDATGARSRWRGRGRTRRAPVVSPTTAPAPTQAPAAEPTAPVPAPATVSDAEPFTIGGGGGPSAVQVQEEDAVLAGASPLRVWICRQYWPLLPGVPERTSRVVLYDSLTPAGKAWRVSQNYSHAGAGNAGPSTTTSYGATGLGSAERLEDGPVRFVATIANPVLTAFGGQSLPVLGIAFGHVAWIELVRVRRLRRLGRRGTRRVMKLMTFPEPELDLDAEGEGKCGCSGRDVSMMGVGSSSGGVEGASTIVGGRRRDRSSAGVQRGGRRDGTKSMGGGMVRTLDIPERVLDGACHIIVDPTVGTVTVTSTSNDLYVYQYA